MKPIRKGDCITAKELMKPIGKERIYNVNGVKCKKIPSDSGCSRCIFKDDIDRCTEAPKCQNKKGTFVFITP